MKIYHKKTKKIKSNLMSNRNMIPHDPNDFEQLLTDLNFKLKILSSASPCFHKKIKYICYLQEDIDCHKGGKTWLKKHNLSKFLQW